MSSETELAWAAGLFEGEGYVYEVRHASQFPYMALGIEMCDKEIMERFSRVMRLNGIEAARLSTRWRGNVKHSRQYAWRVTGRKGESAYLLIRPWLGSRRRLKGDALVAKRRARMEELTAARLCVECGRSFRPANCYGHSAKYCSEACGKKAYGGTPKGLEIRRAAQRRWKERHPEKVKAASKVRGRERTKRMRGDAEYRARVNAQRRLRRQQNPEVRERDRERSRQYQKRKREAA